MISIIFGTLFIILAVTVVRWVVAVPIIRTLSTSIDSWADGVQGEDGDESGPATAECL